MRGIRLGMVVVAAALVLTGCGGSDKGGSGDGADTGKKDGASSEASPASGDDGRSKWGPPETYEVTFEVGDRGNGGTTQVVWMADTVRAETITVPWKKTMKFTLRGAELKVGKTISAIPQGVKDPRSGMLVPPPCAIKVDGKTVAESKGGKDVKGCKYKLKGADY